MIWCLVMAPLPNCQEITYWLCLHMAERSASMASFSDKDTHPITVTIVILMTLPKLFTFQSAQSPKSVTLE